MEPKKSKYDTNPLDPEVVRETEEVWGSGGAPTQQVRGATQQVGAAVPEPQLSATSEAPTRVFREPALDEPYPSVLIPPTYAPPAQYQRPPSPYQPPPQVQFAQKPGSRTVAGVGIPEKWTTVLPYAPFYIGVVASLVELLLVPRREIKVRFHAAQGLALHITILAIHMLFSIVTAVTGSGFGSGLFSFAAFIFLIISMIRVWKGEPHRLAPLAEPTQWLNERIEPRKQN